MRSGFSLLETLVVLLLFAALLIIALPPLGRLRDRASVKTAATAAVAAFDAMRGVALTRGRHTAVRIDTGAGRIVVHAGSDTITRLALRSVWGVSLSSTRDSSAVAPDGLGFGAANLRLVLARGSAAETITVSRLGRVARR